MIVFIRVYPLLETLVPVPQWGRYHHLLHGINDPPSPVGRDPITNMSLLVVILSLMLPFSESVTRGGRREKLWVYVDVHVRM